MNINHKIISIPPYLSTTWNQVRSIQTKENLLIVHLTDGKTVEIPDLNQEQINIAFKAHAAHLEEISSTPNLATLNQSNLQQISHPAGNPLFDTSFRLGFGTLDELGNVLHHNPAQANSPLIPQEILQKIGLISRIIAPSDISQIPEPEKDCNCIHCQVSRAMILGVEEVLHQQESFETHVIEEDISSNDLSFQQWDIQETSPNFFIVINKLDSNERYNVHLGQPIGCTCGKEGCEHIIATLRA